MEHVALYVIAQLEYMELHMGMDEELTESCWPGLKGGQEGQHHSGNLLQAA